MASTGPLRLIQKASLPGVAGEGTAMVVMMISSRRGPRTAGRAKGARTQDRSLHARKAKRALGHASTSPASGELRAVAHARVAIPVGHAGVPVIERHVEFCHRQW